MRNLALLTAALAAFAALLFLAERLRPLRAAVAPLLGRLVVNLLAAAFAFAAAALFVRPVVARLIGAAPEARIGLLPLLDLPVVAEAVLAFLLMDLSFYWWHRANHRVGFLWRFHNVHHLDPDLDLSTAVRFHFGEVALSAAFRVVQIGAIGLGPIAYAVYELCFQAETLFHHANLRLPIRFERALNRLLVTPRMHGIHHSQVRAETNSNYGVVLPWWDRLHRTLRLNVPQAAVVIGIAGYGRPEDNRLRALLTHPFRRQRDYWRRADGTLVERPELAGDPTVLHE